MFLRLKIVALILLGLSSNVHAADEINYTISCNEIVSGNFSKYLKTVLTLHTTETKNFLDLLGLLHQYHLDENYPAYKNMLVNAGLARVEGETVLFDKTLTSIKMVELAVYSNEQTRALVSSFWDAIKKDNKIKIDRGLFEKDFDLLVANKSNYEDAAYRSIMDKDGKIIEKTNNDVEFKWAFADLSWKVGLGDLQESFTTYLNAIQKAQLAIDAEFTDLATFRTRFPDPTVATAVLTFTSNKLAELYIEVLENFWNIARYYFNVLPSANFAASERAAMREYKMIESSNVFPRELDENVYVRFKSRLGESNPLVLQIENLRPFRYR